MTVSWRRFPVTVGDAAPFDGKEYLLAVANRLGTADGGDGEKLNPVYPFLWYIAHWNGKEARWETTESDGYDSVSLELLEPVRWADIPLPEI